MTPNKRDGRIDYVEFPAGATAPVEKFFAAAFGWTFQSYGPTYSSLDDGRLQGGFQADPDDRPKAPLIVLYADDLEAARGRVLAAGGRITREIFEFPGGRRFHFADPAGNELAVWSDQTATN
jgi:uncharacterized protein